jgi:hypothetical protein
MTDRKWNNQGGSSRDGFSFKKSKPVKKDAIPSFEDLKESQVTSFRVAKPRRTRPDYGQFGDAVWVYDFYDDDLTIKEPEIDVPEIREPSDKIPDTYIRSFDPENESTDIFPYSIEDEYELVVKFGSLKLYISSGQAFAARNDINDPRFDLSLVIESSQPISFDNRSPTLINTISLLNSAQNPIYSLYEWLLSKLAIVTDYSAENPDPVLSALRLNGRVLRLPDTDFAFNNQQYGLFYSDGKQPEQICLHAINKVLKFDRSRNPDEGNWLVTYAGEELALCLDLNPDTDLPIVLIQFSLNSLEEIESGDGGQFASIRVGLSQPITTAIDVFVRLSGTADPVFININEVFSDTVSAVSANTLKFTIPANIGFAEARIAADIDPDQLGDKTVVTSLLPDPNYQIDANNDSITTIIKLPKPVVSIVFNSGSPTRLTAGNGAFFIYVSRDYIRNVALDVDLAFTGDAAFDEYQVDNFGFSNQYQVQIPSGQAGVVVRIEPNTTRIYTVDRSIIATVIPFQADTGKYAIDSADDSITAIIAPVVNPIIIKMRPLGSFPDNVRSDGHDFFSTSFLSSNSLTTNLVIDPFNFNNNNLESKLSAVILNGIDDFGDVLFDSVKPVYMFMRSVDANTDGIQFIQIIEDNIKSFLQINSLPDKYLYIVNGFFPSLWIDTPPSFANISIQRHEILQQESLGRQIAANDPIEYSQPYMNTPDSTYGYVDSRWIARISEPSNGTTPQYESFAWAVRVDLQNTENTAFMPITFNPVNGHPTKTLSTQRPQVVNP